MAESNIDNNHELTYEKRSGTDNEGGVYELYLTALFAVKLALDDAVDDIQMASNVSKYGAFDDIVIKVQYKNGTTTLYLLQLKHKKKVHGSIVFINKIKGDFSLEKYKDSYHKDIKARISKGERDDLLRGVELKDVVSCLFTNAVYSRDTNKIILNERASLSCKALHRPDTGFIDTTPEGYHTFQMHTERPGFAQFLNSYLFTDYQKGYKVKINKIQEKFQKSEASRVKKICVSFKKKLQIEIPKDEMNFDGVSEVVRESFKEVESDLLEDVLIEMSGYFRDEYQSAQTLYEDYSSKCAEYSEFFQRFRFYGGQLNSKQVKAAITSRIEQSLGKFKPKVVRKFIDYIWDYFEDNRLLVKQQIQRKLLEVLLPTVLSGEDFENRFQIFRKVTDLNDTEQKLMASKHIKVALQGRKETMLCDIVDPNFCRSLKPEFLLNHMGGVIEVGKILELKCENYIKRKFGKVYHTDLFTSRFRIEDSVEDLQYFKNSVNIISAKPGMGKSTNFANFEYQKDLSTSRFRIEDSVEEEEFLKYFQNRVNIISAKPGMGKSTLLDSLVQYCPSNKLVLKLCLNEWNNDLHNKLQEILEDPLQYILEKSEGICHDEFNKALFDYMKSNNAVMVFIDAFDEISPKYTEDALKIIHKLESLGVRTWVFTRPNLEERLEKKFKTAAIKILPLTEVEIRDYLLKNTKVDGGSLENLIQKMMDCVKIPLYMYILSTVLRSSDWDSDKLQLTDLYEIFVTTKCDIYYKKFGIDLEKNHIADLVPKPENLIDKHQLLSLLVTVGEDFLIKNEVASRSEFEQLLSEIKDYKNYLGLVSVVHGSTPIFCHRTFAEFLTARWLSLNIHHKAFKRIYEYLESDDVAQFWFNKIVTRKHELHDAVVDRNLEVIRLLCKRTGLNLCDSLNRTPLHLAMSCFRDQQSYGAKYLEFASSEIPCKILNEICEHFAVTKSFVSQRDIFGSCWQEHSASDNQIFLGGCHWGCKALMMMYLARNNFLTENKGDIREGIRYASPHTNCLRLLFVCDVFGDFEEIKSKLEVPSDPGVQMDEYLWRNFESDLVYALKFFIANDSPYKSDPRFERRFYNERILNKLLEDTEKKFITGSKNDLKALEERFGLTVITENLNILERVEMVTKIQLSGCTPLCAAAFNGYLNTVKEIVNISGIVNAEPEDEFIPLHYAIDGGNIEVITWLIVAGADVNQMDTNGNVALSHIIKSCSLDTEKTKSDIVELLIDKGANPTLMNHNGKSCFGLAAYYKNLDIVKLFVENGVHVDYRDNKNEWTALRHAIQSGQLEYVKYFLEKGADVNIKVNGTTSLDYALNVNFINWQIVRWLMEKEADINYMANLRVFAPLICAVEENLLDVAQYIVSKQDDVTTAKASDLQKADLNPMFWFILQTVRRTTFTCIHQLLMKNGKYSSATLFSSAIAECRANLWKVPLDKIYITLKIFGRNSSFGKAVQNEYWEHVMLFIENGIKVDYRDNDSEFTALQKAVKTDHLYYVKYFLNQRADVNLKVCDKTSLDLAFENERVNWEMVKLLVESGADVNCRQNQKGYTPLHYAVEEDRLDMVEFLINKGVDVSITDGSGAWTPRQLACHLGRKTIMNYFMQRMA